MMRERKRSSSREWLALLLLPGLSACGGLPTHPGGPDFAGMLERLDPVVLNVRSQGRTRGSGFVIRDNYVMTALHVVQNMPALTVRMGGTEDRSAEIVAQDQDADIALLRVDAPAEWRSLELAADTSLRLGEWIIVIGNPFGRGMTVSAGVAGSEEHSLSGAGIVNWIQTDASINPGNSGGPVLDAHGHVVGLATARLAAGPGAGFITPVAALRRLLQEL